MEERKDRPPLTERNEGIFIDYRIIAASLVTSYQPKEGNELRAEEEEEEYSMET